MKQLAATHRSAIRMLQSFAGLPDSPVVYQQLSELMQQLTACCCQLGLNNNQLLELNEQMKVITLLFMCIHFYFKVLGKGGVFYINIFMIAS